MSPQYQTYLESPEWNGKRMKRLLLSGRACEVCKRDNCALDVHHLTYARIFAEEMEDLMVLCKPHHEEIEGLVKIGAISRVGDVQKLREKTMELLRAPYMRLAPRKLNTVTPKLPANEIREAMRNDALLMKIMRITPRKKAVRAIKAHFIAHPHRNSMMTNALIIYDGVKTKAERRKEAGAVAPKPAAPKIKMETADSNVESVREKLRQRAEIGLRKYGVTTERGDLSRKQWLIHAQEEALDFAVYLERLIRDEAA